MSVTILPSRMMSQRIWETDAVSRENEDLFRVVFESVPIAILIVDRDGRIVLVNAQVEKSFGYCREELLGQPVEILVPERFRGSHPRDRENFFAAPQIRAMGRGRDLYGLCKNGNELPIEIGLMPAQTNAGSMVIATIVDITERKIMEEALRHFTIGWSSRLRIASPN